MAQQKVRALFAQADANGDGRIALEELRVVFGHILAEWGDDQFRQLVQASDTNRDGFLQYQEFLDFVFEHQLESVGMTRQVKDGCYFAGGNDFGGVVSQEEADAICQQNPDSVMGYCWHNGNPGCCFVKKLGTGMGEAPGWTSVVFSKPTKLMSCDHLFNDEYVDGCLAGEEGYCRPGRGQGFLDDKDFKLFGQIHPNDIRQGGIGDCWLMAAMSALAEWPEAVLDVFDQKNLAEDGKYTLNMFDFAQQRMTKVTVDDRLPMVYGTAKYCKPSLDHEIWSCLLEKAFAAQCGGWQKINGNFATFALATMTGCTQLFHYYYLDGGWSKNPISWSRNSNEPDASEHSYGTWNDGTGDNGNVNRDHDHIFNLMVEWDASNFIVCCDTVGGTDATVVRGVVHNHAYSLLQVKPNVAGSGWDMIQVRNPWAETEFEGRWRDGDDLWNQHPEVREELKPQFADDGLFWICKDDFFQHYDALFVCEKEMGPSRVRAEQHAVQNGAPVSESHGRRRPANHRSLKRVDGHFLAGGNDFGSVVSQGEADTICQQNPEKVMGYCWNGANPDHCFVKKLGTGMHPLDGWTTVLVE